MKFKKLLPFILTFCIALLFLVSCNKCKHIWREATCDSPKECSICSATKGKSLGGHNWKFSYTETEATCDQNGTDIYKCSRCHEKEKRIVEPSGHTFYSHICSKCSLTDIKANTWYEYREDGTFIKYQNAIVCHTNRVGSVTYITYYPVCARCLKHGELVPYPYQGINLSFDILSPYYCKYCRATSALRFDLVY